MTDTIIIRLAGVPQGKGRPRFARASGRAFTPAATRSYEAALRYAAQEAMGNREPLAGPLDVTIYAGFPVPKSMPKRDQSRALSGELRPTKKPDADNLAKTCDALNEVVWRDDAQIVELRVRKCFDAAPCLTIFVRPMVVEASNGPG